MKRILLKVEEFRDLKPQKELQVFLQKMTNTLRFSIFLILGNLFFLNGCNNRIVINSTSIAVIENELKNNDIIKTDGITNLKFSPVCEIIRTGPLFVFLIDSCFYKELASQIDTEIRLFQKKFRLNDTVYTVVHDSIDWEIPDGEMAVHVYPLTETIYIGYIRKLNEYLSSREYMFYIIVHGDSAICSKVYRMSGTYNIQ